MEDASIMYPTSNANLADELRALNAIYGDATAIVTSTTISHTTVELRPPQEYCAYLLRVPITYPQSTPQLVGIDSLHLSTDRSYQQSLVYFRALLFTLHQPGEVVLFDVVEDLLEINTERRRLGVKAEYMSTLGEASTRRVSNKLQMLADLSVARSYKAEQCVRDFVNANTLTCSVCMDAIFTINAAILPCRHPYCASCVQQGLQHMYSDHTPLRCCGRPFPYKTIAQFGDLDTDLLDRYTNWFLELEAENPLYCAHVECSVFISISNRSPKIGRCPTCSRHTCVHCKKKAHGGDCKLELTERFLRKQPWKPCPKCNALVERIDGCKIMACLCGQGFCYNCGEKTEGHACPCNNGNPWDRARR